MKLPFAFLACLVTLQLPAFGAMGQVVGKTTYHGQPAATVASYDGSIVTVVFGPMVDGGAPPVGTVLLAPGTRIARGVERIDSTRQLQMTLPPAPRSEAGYESIAHRRPGDIFKRVRFEATVTPSKATRAGRTRVHLASTDQETRISATGLVETKVLKARGVYQLYECCGFFLDDKQFVVERLLGLATE